MSEERVEAVAQVVQIVVTLGRGGESVFGASTMTCEQDGTLSTLSREGLLFGSTEGDLNR
jgi:hypothetical protein